MRNRAQCKLCKEIIESFHEFDYVSCKCDEIAITGGLVKYECFAKNWENFFRVDEKDKVIPVRLEEDSFDKTKEDKGIYTMSKQDMIDELSRYIESLAQLPDQALSLPVSHYDLLRALTLICPILQCDKSSDN